MGGAYGLQTHIWNNNWKTVLLMAGFPVLLILLTYALFLLYAGFAGVYVGNDPVTGYFVWAGQALAGAWPFAVAVRLSGTSRLAMISSPWLVVGNLQRRWI